MKNKTLNGPRGSIKRSLPDSPLSPFDPAMAGRHNSDAAVRRYRDAYPPDGFTDTDVPFPSAGPGASDEPFSCCQDLQTRKDS